MKSIKNTVEKSAVFFLNWEKIMIWPELIEKIRASQDEIHANSSYKITFQTSLPAPDAVIFEVEKQLKIKFPDELIEYLKFSNGITEYMEYPETHDMILNDYLIWPIEKILSETLAHYNYLEKSKILESKKYAFFADNGCGEPFGYVIDDPIMDNSVFVYYPIENRYKKVASNFQDWIIRWCSGKIKT